MKRAKLLAAAALAVASASSLAVTGPIDLSSGSSGFNNTPIAGGFVDQYTFTLTTGGFLTGGITSVVGGTQDVDFASITVVGPTGAFSFTQRLSDPIEVWGLNQVTLGAGSYTLFVIGTNSASVGSYGGDIAVAPVPEPQTYALMLAGLACVGLVARRRKAG